MAMPIAYAARTGTRRNLALLRQSAWRLLVCAGAPLRTEGFRYALDNGAWMAYQAGRSFDARAFEEALSRLGAGADWTVIPDMVCGGLASLDLSLQWMRRVLDASPRALLAVQNGMRPTDVAPWIDETLGIFVGGDTAWKLRTLPEWCALARHRHAWLHVGRVNSARRIAWCVANGATSFDGSSASRYAVTLPHLEMARRQLDFFTPHFSEEPML